MKSKEVMKARSWWIMNKITDQCGRTKVMRIVQEWNVVRREVGIANAQGLLGEIFGGEVSVFLLGGILEP